MPPGELYGLRCYGLVAYHVGHALDHMTKRAAFGLTVVAAIAIGTLLIVVHRHETELRWAAEHALPGPLKEPKWRISKSRRT